MTQKKQLTDMQANFVINYIKNGFNMYRAAKDAGYSESYSRIQSHKLMHNPLIQEKINLLRRDTEKKIPIAWDWKVKKLLRVINEYIPDDNTIALKNDQVKTALTAMQELNRMQGDYAPDKRLSMTVDATKDKLIEVRRQYKEY